MPWLCATAMDTESQSRLPQVTRTDTKEVQAGKAGPSPGEGIALGCGSDAEAGGKVGAAEVSGTVQASTGGDGMNGDGQVQEDRCATCSSSRWICSVSS